MGNRQIGDTVLDEILDYFLEGNISPEDNWAFCDDGSSMGLDHTSSDGTRFWLDLNRDGTISVFWKPVGSTGKSLKFEVSNG